MDNNTENIGQTELRLWPQADQSQDSHNRSAFGDPSIAGNKNAPIHRWVPWIAGFSQAFVKEAIRHYLGKRGTVLDPFAGVGTTLLEAITAGHNAIGFEINPFATLACKTKINAFKLGRKTLDESIERFTMFYQDAIANGYQPRSTIPPGFKTRIEFYSPQVLRKVLIVQDFISKIRQPLLRDIFRIAFASTMVTYSNYSYEPSLSSKVAAGKKPVLDFRVGQTIELKLREMAADIRTVSAQLEGSPADAVVYNESFFNCKDYLKSQSVDMIITSPPYLNNYHYNRNTRPHLYWLGFANSPSDFKLLENQNFGTYWQTARDQPIIELYPEIADSEIKECVKLIRAKNPEKGVYGGNGWANYAAAYFNDCYRFITNAKWILKRRGTALVVIGNNILQGIMIPTDRYLANIAESAGLKLIEIHIPRKTRVGNSIIQSSVRANKAKDTHKLYEAVVELRKR